MVNFQFDAATHLLIFHIISIKSNINKNTNNIIYNVHTVAKQNECN